MEVLIHSHTRQNLSKWNLDPTKFSNPNLHPVELITQTYISRSSWTESRTLQSFQSSLIRIFTLKISITRSCTQLRYYISCRWPTWIYTRRNCLTHTNLHPTEFSNAHLNSVKFFNSNQQHIILSPTWICSRRTYWLKRLSPKVH